MNHSSLPPLPPPPPVDPATDSWSVSAAAAREQLPTTTSATIGQHSAAATLAVEQWIQWAAVRAATFTVDW